MCPDGEPGSVPLGEVEPISREDFEAAAARGWNGMADESPFRPYCVTVEVKVWGDSPEDAAARAVDVCHSRQRGVRDPAVRDIKRWRDDD